MEKIIEKENVKEYYIDGRLSLTIIELGNNKFIVQNKDTKLIGYCKPIDDYETQIELEGNYTIGKNGRLYKTKKLLDHNAMWFSYILQQKGYIRKAKAVEQN